MNTIDFIQNDIKKKTQSSPWAYRILFAVLFLASPIYGFVSRDDGGNALRLQSLFSALAGFVILLFVVKNLLRGEFFVNKTLGIVLMSVVLILAIQTALLYPDTDSVTSQVSCFFKGCSSTIIAGLALSFFAFKFAAWPTRAHRLLLATASGLAGALMLEIHCDSASMGHVFFGHVSQGIFSGLIIYALMEGLFMLKLKQTFSALGKIKNIQKIG